MSSVTKRVERIEPRIEPRIGFHSLVGVRSKDFPLNFGNYFGFWNGYRAVNFWAENLEEAVRRGLIDDIEVEVYRMDEHPKNAWAVVIDKRLEGWTTRPCLTGVGAPRAVKEAMWADHGWGSLEKEICGCEAPHEFSSLTASWTLGMPKQASTMHCGRCKRSWTVPGES